MFTQIHGTITIHVNLTEAYHLGHIMEIIETMQRETCFRQITADTSAIIGALTEILQGKWEIIKGDLECRTLVLATLAIIGHTIITTVEITLVKEITWIRILVP